MDDRGSNEQQLVLVQLQSISWFLVYFQTWFFQQPPSMIENIITNKLGWDNQIGPLDVGWTQYVWRNLWAGWTQEMKEPVDTE